MKSEHHPIQRLRVTPRQLPLVVEFEANDGERKLYEITATRKLGLIMQRASNSIKRLLSRHRDD